MRRRLLHSRAGEGAQTLAPQVGGDALQRVGQVGPGAAAGVENIDVLGGNPSSIPRSSGLTGLGRYADVVAQMDWTVGQVLDALERAGVRDYTLVIFSSDNGASALGGIPIPNHADARHRTNGHWAGGKGQIREGGHRVPLLMQWPRGIEADSNVAATVSLTDVYATLAEIVEEEARPGVAIDSVSLMPLLRGEAVSRGTPVVHHSRSGMFALRDGRWKLVFGNGDGGVHGGKTGEPFGEPWRLFDLEQDPKEATSVAENHPEVMARMEATLERIRSAEDAALSADATLKSLNLAGVDIGTFASDVWTYTAIVGPGVETGKVMAIPTATDARVTIRDPAGWSETGRHGVRLADGTTKITILVTAPDKGMTRSYTVTVTRVDESPAELTIIGTVQVGETLSADTSSIADADGLTNPSYSYQWIRNDGGSDAEVEGATSATYILVAEDEGKTILVRVNFTDDAGNAETRTSEETAAVLASPNAPRGLTVDTGSSGELSVTWQAPDNDGGSEVTGYAVQWKESSGSWHTASDVSETTVTGTSHTIAGLTDGTEYAVRVRAVNDVGAGQATAQATAMPVDPPLTVGFLWMPASHNASDEFWIFIEFSEEITSSGETLRDHALTVTGGEVVSADVFGYSDLWALGIDPDGNGDVTIALPITTDCSATGAVCTGGGKKLSNHIEHTVSGPAHTNSVATGIPTITGTAQMGETLTAETSAIEDADGLNNVDYSYQWLAANAEIAGATSSSYTLADADEGKTIRVRVSFTDDAGNDESLTSAATTEVAAKPNSPATGVPAVSGTARVGETLTADASSIADEDGLTNATFSYQWLADDSDISGAMDSAYTLTDADEGKAVSVRVSFTDDAGNAEAQTSAATAAIAGLPPEPLTAVIENGASSYDGTTVFTFELRFSEELELSYVTLRDHAFTVEGGKVKKAQRMDKSSNIHWRITVEPDSSATVTVVLPVTTDCNAAGAICTEDGRMLSNRTEITVAGPSG